MSEPDHVTREEPLACPSCQARLLATFGTIIVCLGCKTSFVPELAEASGAPSELGLRCGHCGYQPDATASLGEMCMVCNRDGYRMLPTNTPLPEASSAPSEFTDIAYHVALAMLDRIDGYPTVCRSVRGYIDSLRTALSEAQAERAADRAWTTHTEEEIAEAMARYGCSRDEFEAIERLTDVCGDNQGENDSALATVWGALTDARTALSEAQAERDAVRAANAGLRIQRDFKDAEIARLTAENARLLDGIERVGITRGTIDSLEVWWWNDRDGNEPASATLADAADALWAEYQRVSQAARRIEKRTPPSETDHAV